MSEEPDYRSRETITLATACSYGLVRGAFLYAGHASLPETFSRLALLLLVELPLVTLAVALVVNGLVLHIGGGQLRRLARRAKPRPARPDEPAPAARAGEAARREPEREG